VTSYRRLVCSEKALRVRVIVGATRGRLSARSLPVPSSHGACDPFFPARVPARSCAPVARSCCACRATLLCARSSLLATARRARASNLFLARRDARCHACFAHPRRPLASAPTRQSLLSHPRQHATVVVFVEFANTLLSIRLPSLLYASCSSSSPTLCCRFDCRRCYMPCCVLAECCRLYLSIRACRWLALTLARLLVITASHSLFVYRVSRVLAFVVESSNPSSPAQPHLTSSLQK
jgi:hypothetical protein